MEMRQVKTETTERWIFKEGIYKGGGWGGWAGDMFKCSACGYIHSVYGYGIKTPNFCPDCGTDMRAYPLITGERERSDLL